MMLKTQQELAELGIAAFCEKYGVNSSISPCKKLASLSYDQIDSKKFKYNEVISECRGLVVDLEDNFKIIARPLSRFFNLGENKELDDKFDWNSFDVLSKEDGSLILLYFYDGQWRVNTRNSFGLGLVGESGRCWLDWFYELIDQQTLDYLCKDTTYIFEFCSIWNKIVRYYPEPKLYLLAARHKLHGEEIEDPFLDTIAANLGVDRPGKYSLRDVQEVLSFLDKCEDATFEGFVLRDKNNMRLKVKSAKYVALHMLRGENLFASKYLLEFILKGETDELITYYPEVKDKVLLLEKTVVEYKESAAALYELHKNIPSQKDFALAIKHNPLSCLMFSARRNGASFKEQWKKDFDYLVKFFSEK